MFYESSKETDPVLRVKKSTKNVQNFSKAIYFSLTVIWGTSFLRKTDYLPWYLFGDGELSNLYKNHPIHTFPTELKLYYLVTLGYYLDKTVQDLWHREKRNDFIEMMLHHLLTINLYVGGYMLNSMAIGSLVIISLDWTQIFIGFSRSFSETKFKKLTAFFGFGMWFSWMYFRMMVFPVVIYQGYYYLPRKIPVKFCLDE
jgi:hypothetical protein